MTENLVERVAGRKRFQVYFQMDTKIVTLVQDVLGSSFISTHLALAAGSIIQVGKVHMRDAQDNTSQLSARVIGVVSTHKIRKMVPHEYKLGKGKWYKVLAD